MQLTSNASINLVPPEWWLVRCLRVKGQGSRAEVKPTTARNKSESQEREREGGRQKGNEVGKITREIPNSLYCPLFIKFYYLSQHSVRGSIGYYTKNVFMGMRYSGREVWKETSIAHLIGIDQLLHAVFEHSIKVQSMVGVSWRERRQTMALFFKEPITS